MQHSVNKMTRSVFAFLCSASGIIASCPMPSMANAAVTVACSNAGRVVMDPIFAGTTLGGSPIYIRRSSSGLNAFGPPYPVVACFNT